MDFSKKNHQTLNLIVIASILVLASVILRWLPHAPNFSPILAVGIFAGAQFGRSRLTFLIPVLALLLSDLLLGFYEPAVMLVVYSSVALAAFAGIWLHGRRQKMDLAVGGTSIVLGSSLFFFFATNAAVWMFQNIYPRGLEGLVQAILAGLPFLHNTVASTAVYSVGLFGIYALVDRFVLSKSFAKNLL